MAVSLQTAHEIVVAACRPLAVDDVPVADAAGRVLAHPLSAAIDLPAFDNSAMDGFAVTPGPAGRRLSVIDAALAGRPADTRVDDATAIRISTGAALPPGAGAVVADEQADFAGPTVALRADAPAGLNIRRAGEDVPAGRHLLDAGTRLGPVELAVAIGTGHGRLACHRRPRVAVLATGNELRPPGAALRAGQIHDSNTTTIAALATQAGAALVSCGRVADDPRATRDALAAAFDHADLVILSGGVSVGPQDHVRAALADLGAVDGFAGVHVRPGRPAWFGTRAGVPVLALPGNPVAAIVVFVLLARPALAALSGAAPAPARERARLTRPVRASPGRTNVVGATLRQTDDRPLEADPTGPLSAHATGRLLGLDALLLIGPADAWLDAGTPVELLRIAARP